MTGWVLITAFLCTAYLWGRYLTRLERVELARIASEESARLRTAYAQVADANDRLTRTTEAHRLQVERLQAAHDKLLPEVGQLTAWRTAHSGLVSRGR